MTERTSPVFDSFRDEQVSQLEALALDNGLSDFLNQHADLITTTLRVNNEIRVERDDIPAELEEIYYFPHQVTCSDIDAQLIRHPKADLWALQLRYMANGVPFSVTSSPNGTEITTENYDDGMMTTWLPTELSTELVGMFMKNQDTAVLYVEQTIEQKLGVQLEELGNQFGYSLTTHELNQDLFGEICRSLTIELLQFESKEDSAKLLRVDGAIDFGSEPTRFTYTQRVSSDPSVETREKASIERILYPIDNFLIVKELRTPGDRPIEATSETPGELATTKNRIAPLVLTTLGVLERELDENGFNSPDAGGA